MSWKSYKGWYKIQNPEKFVEPKDDYMQSYNKEASAVQYKSRLELQAFKYCDLGSKVHRWSVEPFPIQYLKPTDGMLHRYFVDLMIEFTSGKKVLVEVKSSSQTKAPKVPKKSSNAKSTKRYAKDMMLYKVNEAKWNACIEFCEENDMEFKFLTEKQLHKVPV